MKTTKTRAFEPRCFDWHTHTRVTLTLQPSLVHATTNLDHCYAVCMCLEYRLDNPFFPNEQMCNVVTKVWKGLKWIPHKCRPFMTTHYVYVCMENVYWESHNSGHSVPIYLLLTNNLDLVVLFVVMLRVTIYKSTRSKENFRANDSNMMLSCKL